MDRAVVPTVVVSALSIPLLGPNGAAGILNALPFLSVIISTSLNILNFVSAAAERGILIKDGRTLELLSSVDTLVFDKTGTLTLSQPHVGSIQPCPGYTADAVLTYAAAAERRHSHPIALAIVQAAQARNLPLPPLDAAHYQLGRHHRHH